MCESNHYIIPNNSTEKDPYLEANWSLTSQETTRDLWNSPSPPVPVMQFTVTTSACHAIYRHHQCLSCNLPSSPVPVMQFTVTTSAGHAIYRHHQCRSCNLPSPPVPVMHSYMSHINTPTFSILRYI